jgi:hypothetical protein
MALNSLKASCNYLIVFKTNNSALSSQVDKTSNPNLQFLTTAKYLSKCYFTMFDIIQNTTSNVSFSQVIADLKINVNDFNQSKYFKKSAVSLS